MKLLEVNNLSFYYPEQEKATIGNITFSLNSGEFVVLQGASGCGKTTLLRQFKSSIAPHGVLTGEILFNGTKLADIPHKEESSDIGFVEQSAENQIVTDKVWHELAFGLESLGLPQDTIRARVAEMASFFGIQNWFYKKCSELSGGQKQLLNLASVMVMQPKILILDEPTSQLDPIAAHEFLETVSRINRELGTTVLMTEHRLEEAFPLADRVLTMDKGHLILDATPGETGRYLKANGHKMFQAMPSAMRIYAGLDADGISPITVREGHDFLLEYSESHPVKELPPEAIRENDNEPVITLDDVWFRYEKDAPDVVRGVSYTVKKGEFAVILGGNGTGKSTTLSLISGIRKPYRGTVSVKGTVSLLPQDPKTLFLKKTVLEDLREVFGGKAKQEKNEEKINQVISLCRLDELLGRHPYDLSGGEQQRVALAKLLLTDPEILLLDEPTKGLDADFKRELAQILRELIDGGKTVLMVSHDVEFCAEFADTLGLFFNGEIVSRNTPRAFFSENNFYTTSVSRMARDLFPGVVTVKDVLDVLGGKALEYDREAEVENAELSGDAECAATESAQEGAQESVQNGAQEAARKPAQNHVQSYEQAKKKKPLPVWRIVLAVVFGAIAFGTFIFTVTHTDLTALIGQGGLTDLAKDYMWIYAVLILSLAGLAASITRKSEKAPAPKFLKGSRKLSKRTLFAAFSVLLLIPLTVFLLVYFHVTNYYIMSVAILVEAMIPFALVFEKRKPKPRELVVIAVMSALGVAGRAMFFMFPSFKPVFAIVIISGVAFGGETGFLVGALTMLLSNMIFGQGPWTPMQMFSVGIIGLLAGILFKKGVLRRSRLSLAVFGVIAAIVIFGGIMNPASALMWGSGETFSWKLILTYYLSGFPVDVVQAAATALFLWVGAEPMLEKLDRIKVKYGLVE